MVFGLWDDNNNDPVRTLSIRDRQILWERAKKRYENPACNKKIDFTEMQVGHKIAHSRGGKTSMKNAVCLCYKCNKLQGTDSWIIFLKKQGVEDPKIKEKQSIKQSWENLSLKQLKFLATKLHITVKGEVEEGWFESHQLPPTKKQYIQKLAGKATAKDINSIPKDAVKPVKKKRTKKSDDSWW